MSRDVAAAAQAIERGMPGMRVATSAWPIALGEATGAISWQDQLRIIAAVQAASEPKGSPFARRRRAGALTCRAAG